MPTIVPAMPVYTIQRDPSWVPTRLSTIAPTTSSIYSDESDTSYQDFAAVSIMPASLERRRPPSDDERVFAHAGQVVTDPGPQLPQSKVPIFQQVRGLLNKRSMPGLSTAASKAGWDEFTGEPSDTGKPRFGQKPSTYESPFELAFKNVRGKHASPSPVSVTRSASQLDISPVSVLRDASDDDNEIKPVVPLKAGRCISPISSSSPISIKAPTPLSINARTQPGFITESFHDNGDSSPLSVKPIKRKPVARLGGAAENISPPSSSHTRDGSSGSRGSSIAVTTQFTSQNEPNSHFSWTTYAPSQRRPSIDTYTDSRSSYPPLPHEGMEPNHSRFSWSTVNTNATHFSGPLTSPGQPPQIPRKYLEQPSPIEEGSSSSSTPQPPQYNVSQAPMQSILSRARPVPRIEKAEWSPAHSPALGKSGSPFDAHKANKADNTPSAVVVAKRGVKSSPPKSVVKTLPRPPTAGDENKTHLENLYALQKDLGLQRHNVEKVMAKCEKVVNASPLDVSFEQVRQAKRKLQELRAVLDEVLLEERQIGINISRARRKEGEEEGLWVRRVTG